MVAISVVVPALEPPEEIAAVRALRRGDFTDYEVLVTDDTPVTRARNVGIERAKADKIVFLDDDSRPTSDYLERAADVLDREAAFAGRTVHPRDDIFARRFAGHYDRGDSPRYVERFWGNNMGVRREVFETVGGWDENMGWGHEEKELADRVAAEYDILYHPDLVVVHPYADSVPDYWRKKYRLETQTLYYWRKRGITTVGALRRITVDALDPRTYVRRGVTATLVNTGAQVAKTAGRVRGVLDSARSSQEDVDSGVPRFVGRGDESA